MYYYPNRPLLITLRFLEKYENEEYWIGEIKKNGDRLELIKTNKFLFYNRYGKLLHYSPPDFLLEELHKLSIPKGTQLDGEFLHNKTKHIKNFIYVYDIYTWKGEEITDKFIDRRKRLEDIFAGFSFEHLILAPQYKRNFLKTFNKVIKKDENEGLVLKNINGKIVFNVTKSQDVWWQVKIRKSTKNYSF